MSRMMNMMQANIKGRMNQEHDRSDDDLSLFRELRKRQNDHVPSFLINGAASEEYECDTNIGGSVGKFSLYRIHSGKKEHGEFMETNKNDYDWLKTPPATPLFPSLEMEPNAHLVTQKEIPISQPISRLAKSDMEVLKPKSSDGRAKHANSTKAKLPMRSITPSHNKQRPSILKKTNAIKSDTPPTTTNQNSYAKIHDAACNTKSTPQKQTNNADFLALNLKKSIETNESQNKPRTRGVSPSVKSRAEGVKMVELSNGAPPNLRTEQRPSSTTRGRSTTRASTVGGFQKPDPTPKACRPSRSPSPSMSHGGWNQLDRTQKNMRQQKEIFTLASGNNESKSHFKGSKMVEKMMNARKSSINQADKETKAKPVKYG
ncbi:uncharacterized protein LOC130745380 [Lotus japonicus]|uniref:uncharacterized protein LOC130745380 n=1 Tax=Lotus japonicus TaxID=34305 RepID=UPI002585568E|nr:uncharacterized protein LOC130745380 [Lotus japonicus]